MALSKAQKQILDKYHVSRELQDWVAREFNEQGDTKAPGAPDFLMVISDHLQAAETYLETQRRKLNKIQNPREDRTTSPEEWQTLLNAYEEVVKEAWERATGYWRIIDQVITNPKEYGVKINRQHIDYAFQKKNLPLVEMLKWSKPEYFFIPNPSFIERVWSGFWAGLGGIFTGMVGGIVWSKRHASKQKSALRRYFLLLLYSATAFFTGMMMGAITGARRGYQIGKIVPAAKLGYFAAAYNPFVEPKGSKHKQAIDLKTEETLFQLFETENAKQILIQNLDERFQIRFAKEDDIGLILNFIKELAAHEKILSEVLATEATLKETLFGEKPKAEVLLGYLDDKPVSCLIFYPNYFSVLARPGLFIEDLYIQRAYRGYGLGVRMLAFLANLAIERDCKRIDWLVSHRNINAKEFYGKMGAKPLRNWTPYRLEGESLQRLARRARSVLM